MPYKPNKPLKRMKTNLKNLKALFISMVVNVRLDINVIAITIIVIGDAIPAETDASPKTMAPSMEIAEP